jgi:hypothetical protein
MSQRLSPDGMYYWDGQAWVSTLSADGLTRWNGDRWVPVSGQAEAPPGGSRQPTPWTRPLQLTVIAWYVFSALYTASLPFWMSGLMNQVVNQAIQRQQEQSGRPMPAGFADTMSSLMTGVFWASAVFGIAIAVVAIVAALRRWTWAYYAILVLLGLGLLGLPVNLANALGGGTLTAAQGLSMPVWTSWVGLGTGLVAAALFVWMVIALTRYGPWAMRRVS